MLGPRAILSWFTLCLVASNVAAANIDDLFNLPSNTTAYGTCNNNLTRLNEYSKDFTTLCTQLDNAVQLARTPGVTEAKLVARQLFTAWFGIQFNTDGTVQTAGQTAWTVVQNHISRLYSLISLDGEYQAPKSPANLFCNDFGDIYPWDSFIIDSQGEQMQPGISVAYFYSDWVPTLPGAQLPYYVAPINEYYMMSPSTFMGNEGADLCGPGGLEGLNSFGSPRAESTITILQTGEIFHVVREAISDFVLICPNVLSDGVASAWSYGYSTLSDIPLFAVDLTLPVQLRKVRPKSAVLLHEILHMVSRWDGYGTNAANGATMIVDYSYDVFDCLGFAIQPQQVIMSGAAVTAFAYLNTENYVNFALAWWYYNSRTDWQGTTPATFYAGFLQPWTDF